MPFKEKEYNRIYQKQLRERRKILGVCSIDGKNKPTRPGGVCRKCLQHRREVQRKLKMQVSGAYGGKCQCCGETAFEFLSVDHVNGRGAAERKRLGHRISSASLYRRIIQAGFPKRYQILCMNCNCALGFFGYCPHHPRVHRRVQRLPHAKRKWSV